MEEAKELSSHRFRIFFTGPSEGGKWIVGGNQGQFQEVEVEDVLSAIQAGKFT